MRTNVEVTFEGSVFTVHVLVGGHEVGIAKDFAEDKWTGTTELDVVGGSVMVEMRFTAPSFTDWELTIKFNDEEVLSESGRSNSPRFSFRKEVSLTDSQ